MPIYAVTGASGHLGRLAVRELLALGVPAGDLVNRQTTFYQSRSNHESPDAAF